MKENVILTRSALRSRALHPEVLSLILMSHKQWESGKKQDCLPMKVRREILKSQQCKNKKEHLGTVRHFLLAKERGGDRVFAGT